MVVLTVVKSVELLVDCLVAVMALQLADKLVVKTAAYLAVL